MEATDMTKGQKIQETRAKKAEARKSQSVTIGNWTIERFDDLNWTIKFKGNFKGYYGTLESALLALPRKMLDETSFNSLSDIHRNLRAIRDCIHDSLNPI